MAMLAMNESLGDGRPEPVRHSRWLLQRLLSELHRLMSHPWVRAVSNQAFTVKQYAAWLARLRAAFAMLEQHVGLPLVEQVHDAGLSRTAALEADLCRVLGADWHGEAAEAARGSPATQRYLAHLEADTADAHALLAHHFMWYGLALSGGSVRLGKELAERLVAPRSSPGVHFYTFAGAVARQGPDGSGWGPTRLGQYLRDFDALSIDDDGRTRMLAAMRRMCASTEAMMDEVCSASVSSTSCLPRAGGRHGRQHRSDLGSNGLELDLQELRQHTGEGGKSILFCVDRLLFDVSCNADLYGPSGEYSVLAGRDVTRCLATMSLEVIDLDDLDWKPCTLEDREALQKWRKMLKAEYPVVGRLRRSSVEEAALPALMPLQRTTSSGSYASSTGSRSRANTADDGAAVATHVALTAAVGQRCPISGRGGAGCPIAAFVSVTATKVVPGGSHLVGTLGSSASGTVRKVPTSSCFMFGMGIISSVRSSAANEESLLYALCPSNWDHKTLKVVICIASAAWIGGVCVGWILARSLPMLRRSSSSERRLTIACLFTANGGPLLITALWLRRRLSVQ